MTDDPSRGTFQAHFHHFMSIVIILGLFLLYFWPIILWTGTPETDRVATYIKKNVRFVDPIPDRIEPCMYTMTMVRFLDIDCNILGSKYG